MKNTKVVDVKDIVVRFSGDSGDGMQLIGNIFSNISAITGNQIATFPDYPAEIRAPQGTLSGVSGYQVRIGADIYSSGEKTDVLVAMNPAALKVNIQYLTKDSIIIVDSDSFTKRDLEKAQFKTENPFKELGIEHIKTLEIPITSLTISGLEGFDLTPKNKARCKNIFTLGVICWLFDRSLEDVNTKLSTKFAKKQTLADANIKVLLDGYNFGHNTNLSVPIYKVETVDNQKGFYTDITGNKATAYGLVAASEKSGRPLFLGSYPITPATDILQELAKLKSLGVKVVQAEDEIAGVCTAIGASFAGCLAVTTTSGPGLALKSEAIGLAVIAELPLVVVDVQRGGPSTGLPTKSEQTDLMQAIYGRNGESPIVVLAGSTPTNCFDMAYWAAKIAMEHMTPVILLTDGYIANGSSAWKIPSSEDYMKITPNDVSQYKGEAWNVAERNPETFARYWAKIGDEGFTHRIGGLEKDFHTGDISTNPDNHQKMVNLRKKKIDTISNYIPQLEVVGDKDADLLVVGWGGTYGHIREAVDKVNETNKLAYTHFNFISPLPNNTEELFKKYKKVIVVEQNNAQFASYLKGKIDGVNILSFNEVKGQPFAPSELVEFFTNELKSVK